MEHIWKSNENENDELVSNIFLGLSGFVLLIWILVLVKIFEVNSDIIGIECEMVCCIWELIRTK